MADELEPYNSFEDDSPECLFCRQSTNDTIQLGKKLSVDGITAHHYCMVSIENYSNSLKFQFIDQNNFVN